MPINAGGAGSILDWGVNIPCALWPNKQTQKQYSNKFNKDFKNGPWTSLMAQTVKHLPTKQKTRFQSLGREDPLEKEMATHSSVLAWKIPWMEEPGRLQSIGSQRVRHDWATSFFVFNSPHIHKKILKKDKIKECSRK